MYNILYNVTMLLALSIFFATYPFKSLRRLGSHKILVGIIIGALGILVMLNPLRFSEGLFFDSRTILVVVTGMAYGTVPTVVGSALMIIYRLAKGGEGLVIGIVTIVTSAIIGTVWHHYRFEKTIEKKIVNSWELYGVGIITHLLMLITLFIIPPGTRSEVIRVMLIPLLVIYPLGTYLLSLLLFRQARTIADQIETEKSERLFKTMFEEAPIGMSLTDMESGTIMNINQSYLDLLGYERDEMIGHRWEEFTHPGDMIVSEEATERMYFQEVDELNLDKRLIRKDGSVVWLNLSLSIFATVDMDHLESLGMALDVTERKSNEQRILWASDHDALTGLYNRVHFENYVDRKSVV